MSVDKDSMGDRMKVVLPARFYVESKSRAAALFAEGVNAHRAATILGLPRPTAYAWLRRWREGGLDRLLNRPATHEFVPLSDREAQVLDGLMLGDGSLVLSEASVNACLMISRSAIDLDYQHWTAAIFADRMAGEPVHVRDVRDPRTGKTYHSARLRTRSDPALREQRARWYPSGRKIVPPDLRLSALVVAVWLADDGHVAAASRRCPEVRFATQGFEEQDVRQLGLLLQDRYGGRFAVHQEGRKAQFTIRVAGATARALLRDVDPVFPPVLRKSARWRATDLLREREDPPPCRYCRSGSVYHWGRTAAGVRKFKCLDCRQVSRESYERRPRGVMVA